MIFPEDKSRIERLKKALYSRESYKTDSPIEQLKEKPNTVDTNWQPTPAVKPKKPWPLLKIVLWFSIGFFIVAVSIAGYLFYSGSNTVSADNVSITTSGPTIVPGGQELDVLLSIENQNKVDLNNVYLRVTYPSGARKSVDAVTDVTYERISLGSLASGSHVDKTIQALFYGPEGAEEKINVSLEYKVTGSDTLFTKDKDYLFTLGPAPVTVMASHVTEINSGQNVTFTVDVTSNSTTALQNVALEADYPFGFTYTSATPKPDVATNVWQLGALNPGEKKTIKVVGKLEGQENEERAFRFNVGVGNPNDPTKIATTFLTQTENITIKKPFIGLSMTVDGVKSQPAVIENNTVSHATVSFSNNLTVPVVDAVIQIKITGGILDKSSIASGSGGFYQSADNTITWDKRQIPVLANLNPGDQGTIDFTFNTLPFLPGASYTKSSQKINFTTTVNGTRVSANSGDPVTSSISNDLLINTHLALNARALYYSGTFKNTGGLPPQAEKETTYTIVWSITNTFNNASGARVSAILPPYVKFISPTSSTSEVTYNSVSGEVIWNVGSVKANVGYTDTLKQVAFQVSLKPSLNQVGNTLDLIGESSLMASDAFTKQALTDSEKPLSTELTTDPLFQNGQGVVVQ